MIKLYKKSPEEAQQSFYFSKGLCSRDMRISIAGTGVAHACYIHKKVTSVEVVISNPQKAGQELECTQCLINTCTELKRILSGNRQGLVLED